ncbi:hypothetical protein BDF14DRAFT_1742243 [Spinellus fusiger]|nr:hypothetical protein BDF14DRAFT_1742243 [Spinellus fusiger]
MGGGVGVGVEKRPAVLDIAHLLCDYDVPAQSPSLSPSLTPSSSPASMSSSYSGYPFSHGDSFVWTTAIKSDHETDPIIWNPTDTRGFHQELSSERTCLSPNPSSMEEDEDSDDGEEFDENGNPPVKAKRRRANAKQLEVLNRVFDRTFFPSTQMRVELGRQLGMSPRTVQIWFQNRRQAIRTRERQRLIRLRDKTSQ